jgi:hypothetical protein
MTAGTETKIQSDEKSTVSLPNTFRKTIQPRCKLKAPNETPPSSLMKHVIEQNKNTENSRGPKDALLSGTAQAVKTFAPLYQNKFNQGFSMYFLNLTWNLLRKHILKRKNHYITNYSKHTIP